MSAIPSAMGEGIRRRQLSLLGALVASFTLAACSGGTPTAAPSPSQSASTSPSGASTPSAVDARLLPVVTSSSVDSGNELEGRLELRVKPQGMCATLRTVSWWAGPFVRWPAGYRVVGGDPMRVQDERGHFVAAEGDYLWLRGEAGDVAQRVVPDDVRCPMPGGRSFDVTKVSEPGRPFGVTKRQVMVIGPCDGRPVVRPELLMLACDGGKSLNDIRWTSWGRAGAAGTARLHENCYNPMGADDMRVTFTYSRVDKAYSLRLLEDLRIDYPREPCS